MPKRSSSVALARDGIAEHEGGLPIGQLDLLAPAFGSADGYGNSAEQIALALERAGVNVAIVGAVQRAGYSNASHIRDRARDRDGDVIVFYTLPTSWLHQAGGRKSFGFSMYEADRLPSSWLPRLGCVSEIWVPSTWNAELFTAAQSHLLNAKRAPVHVIPLGVDAEAFSFARRVRGDPVTGGKLRFLHFCSYGGDVRKGGDLAIRAFQAAFRDRDDVELILRSTFTSSGLDVYDPRIHNDYGVLSTDDLAAYYRTFDALLYPSRGEGFGLIPLEAMATGMPAIYARATGMADYGDLGLSVDVRPIAATAGVDSASIGAPFGLWQEPRFEQLVARLREVDENYEAVMVRAGSDASTIATRWTWDRTAAAIVERLQA